ncbi:MAG: hypothetical protein WCE46_01180, partial [Methanoregula sp.]|uniref:hypothetical protein n=1 Tax=Methanoregula sp. TaxID=2052170 RepID=UPI003C72899B
LFLDLLCMIQQTIDCAAVKIPDGNDVMRGNSSRARFVRIICTSRPNVPIFQNTGRYGNRESGS